MPAPIFFIVAIMTNLVVNYHLITSTWTSNMVRPKDLAFRLTGCFLMILTPAFIALTGRFRKNESFPFVPIVLFLGWCVFSFLLMKADVVKDLAFFGKFTLIDYAFFWLFAFLMAHSVATVETARRCVAVVCFAFTGVLLFAFLQDIVTWYMTGVSRDRVAGSVAFEFFRWLNTKIVHEIRYPGKLFGAPDSTQGNPNFFGGVLTVVLPLILGAFADALAAARARRGTGLVRPVLFGLLLAISSYYLVRTEHIAALVSTVFAVVLFAAIFLAHRRGWLGWYAANFRRVEVFCGTVIASFLVCLAIVAVLLYTPVGERLALARPFRVRLTMWKSQMGLFSEQPITGHGIGTCHLKFPDYRPRDYRIQDVSHLTQHAHNEYLEVLGDVGVVGLVLYLLVFGAVLLMMLRALNRVDSRARHPLFFTLIGIVSSLAGVFLMVTTCVNLRWTPASVPFYIVLGLGLGIAEIVRRGEAVEPDETVPDRDKSALPGGPGAPFRLDALGAVIERERVAISLVLFTLVFVTLLLSWIFEFGAVVWTLRFVAGLGLVGFLTAVFWRREVLPLPIGPVKRVATASLGVACLGLSFGISIDEWRDFEAERLTFESEYHWAEVAPRQTTMRIVDPSHLAQAIRMVRESIAYLDRCGEAMPRRFDLGPREAAELRSEAAIARECLAGLEAEVAAPGAGGAQSSPAFDGKRAQALFVRAMTVERHALFRNMEFLLNVALAIDPKSMEARARLAHLYRIDIGFAPDDYANNLKKAERIYREILADSPYFGYVRHELAKTYEALARHATEKDERLRYLEMAVVESDIAWRRQINDELIIGYDDLLLRLREATDDADRKAQIDKKRYVILLDGVRHYFDVELAARFGAVLTMRDDPDDIRRIGEEIRSRRAGGYDDRGRALRLEMALAVYDSMCGKLYEARSAIEKKYYDVLNARQDPKGGKDHVLFLIGALFEINRQIGAQKSFEHYDELYRNGRYAEPQWLYLRAVLGWEAGRYREALFDFYCLQVLTGLMSENEFDALFGGARGQTFGMGAFTRQDVPQFNRTAFERAVRLKEPVLELAKKIRRESHKLEKKAAPGG